MAVALRGIAALRSMLTYCAAGLVGSHSMRAIARSASATPLRTRERHDPGLTSRPPSRNPAMKSDVDQRDSNTQRVDSVTR